MAMALSIVKLLQNPRNRKILFRMVLFINILIMLTALSSLVVVAFGAEPEAAAQGDKFMGAGIAVAGSTLGAGIAIYGTASSGMAALVEKSELSTWLLLLAGLGEGVAIYGLIIAIMILGT